MNPYSNSTHSGYNAWEDQGNHANSGSSSTIYQNTNHPDPPYPSTGYPAYQNNPDSQQQQQQQPPQQGSYMHTSPTSPGPYVPIASNTVGSSGSRTSLLKTLNLFSRTPSYHQGTEPTYSPHGGSVPYNAPYASPDHYSAGTSYTPQLYSPPATYQTNSSVVPQPYQQPDNSHTLPQQQHHQIQQYQQQHQQQYTPPQPPQNQQQYTAPPPPQNQQQQYTLPQPPQDHYHSQSSVPTPTTTGNEYANSGSGSASAEPPAAPYNVPPPMYTPPTNTHISSTGSISSPPPAGQYVPHNQTPTQFQALTSVTSPAQAPTSAASPTQSQQPSSPFRPPATSTTPSTLNHTPGAAGTLEELKKAYQNVTDLQQQLSSRDVELNKARSDMNNLRNQLQQQQHELTSKTGELQTARGEIAALKMILEQVKEELVFKDGELVKSKAEIVEYISQLTMLGSQLEQKTLELGELELAAVQLQLQGFNVSSLTEGPVNQAAYQQAEVVAMHSELEALRLQLQKKDGEIARLRDENSNLQASRLGYPFSQSQPNMLLSAPGQHPLSWLTQAQGGFSHGQMPYGDYNPREQNIQTGLTPSNTILSPESKSTPFKLSKVQEEWQRIKSQEHAGGIDLLDDFIVNFVGMDNVKMHLLKTKAKIDTMIRQGVDLNEEAFDLLVTGNPGTLTEHIARIYGLFLLQYADCLPGKGHWECHAAECFQDSCTGIDIIKGEIDGVLACGGGIVEVREVHLLVESTNPDNNNVGMKVLDYILTEMEKERPLGRFAFVIAGNTSVIDRHATLASRFPSRLHIEDFTDEEILLWLGKLINDKYKGRMQVEGGLQGMYMQVVARRIGRGRSAGRDGKFQNYKDIERSLARIRERQGDRLSRERREGVQVDDFFLTKEDLIGPNPSQVKTNCPALAELNSMIGLRTVKESLQSMIELIETNYWRELQGKPPSMQVSLNRVFLGSPGTGKTSVARLYGQILAHFGLLSTSEVVVKSAADFVGDVLGQSEAKTKAILAATVGKVLIIDEAYLLHPPRKHGTPIDIYKVAIIDTIVAEVQSTPGEDRCVLLLGYEDEMKRMFQEANPGLARRFALEDAFYFEDYSQAELCQIFELKLKNQGLHATPEAKHVASEVLGRAKVRPNFGNAGEVENVISQAKLRYQARISKLPPQDRPDEVLFLPVDLDLEYARGASAAANCRKLFEDMIGSEEIVAKLEGYQRIAQNAKTTGCPMHELIPTNFLFKGPPGTGKTMVARKMGKVYYDMGFLATDKVIECSSSDFISVYNNEIGQVCQKLFEKALGQVLFIDEAYRLAEGGGREALNEIVDILTKPKFLGKMVVILAGYDEDMNRLLSVNTGLSSRFPEELIFKNMSPEHCVEVLARELEQKKISAMVLRDVGSEGYNQLCDMVYQLSVLPLWGNARDIKALAKSLVGIAYKVEQVGPGGPVLTQDQILGTVWRLLAERKTRANNTTGVTVGT